MSLSAISIAANPTGSIDLAALSAQLTAREARIQLLEEENRWLKSQLFGRSSEKRGMQIAAEQGRLFNEIEALAASSEAAPEAVQIPAHERQKKCARKSLSADLPRIEIVHDLPDSQKVCATCEGTALRRIGEECSEQLDYQPAKVRVLKHIRPKYACPCCHAGVKIAPVPLSIFPKSLASPALLAHIATAKFVDHIPLYRQETQFARLGVILGRATMAGWMIRLGTTHLTPLINLLAEHMLNLPLIHCDETRLQVLEADPKNGKAPASDHWMWVRCAGPPGKRIVLFDYDASRAGAVPKRLLEGYRGFLLTDGYEAYAQVAAANSLVHAGCWAHYPEPAVIRSALRSKLDAGVLRGSVAPDNPGLPIKRTRGRRARRALVSTAECARARVRHGSRIAPKRRASS